MKTIKIILGFISLLYLSSYSQIDYDSIMVESKIWSNLSGGYDAEMIECCYQTSFVKFEIDPLINTIDEKQVMISTDSLKTWTKVGNIKESDKKIYFRDLENNQGLIYDFGAEEGSIIYLVNYYNYYKDTIQVRIDKIDTVNYLGKNRRCFEVIYNSGRLDYWIEGIGSVKGILNPCLLDGGFRELLCTYDNGVQIYQNTDRMNCYINGNCINPIAGFNYSILESYPIQIDLKSTATYADSIIWKGISNYSLKDTIIGTGDSLRIDDPYDYVVLMVDCTEPPCYNTIDITQIVINECGIDSITKAVPVENYTIDVSLNNTDFIKCYPNPTAGKINIKGIEYGSDLYYVIFNSTGHKVQQRIVESKIHIGVPDGLYLLLIIDKKEILYQDVILINNNYP